MDCRKGCGACCIAPEIVQPFYQMPNGKRALEPCVHLDAMKQCRLFNDPRRPTFCRAFEAEQPVCRDSFEQAMIQLIRLDEETSP